MSRDDELARRTVRGLQRNGSAVQALIGAIREHSPEVFREFAYRETRTMTAQEAHNIERYLTKRAEFAMAYGASQSTLEELFMNPNITRPPSIQTPNAYPQAPAPIHGVLSNEDRVQRAKIELADAEAALATETANKELADKIDGQQRLAQATLQLLQDIKNIRLSGYAPEQRKQFAEYRKELAALAAEYGYKLVLVGNKTVAVLVEQ